MLLSFVNKTLLAVEVPSLDNIGKYLLNRPPADDVPKALDDLWVLAMNGNLYNLVCNLGLVISVLAVGFWCVKFFFAMNEGNLQPASVHLVWPMILVILLANGGKNMKDLTVGTRNIMNGFNQSVGEVVSAEVNVQTVMKTIFGSYAAKELIRNQVIVCNEIRDINAFNTCMKGADIAASAILGDYSQSIKTSIPGLNERNKRWEKELLRVKEKYVQPKTPTEAQVQAIKNAAAASAAGTVTDAASTPMSVSPSASSSSSSASASSKPAIFNALKVSTYSTSESMQSVIDTLLSTRSAFIYILESMLLVTGLLGPVFVGLSLFPVGAKPLIAWAVSFLTISFCKICYNLISGLSAIAMVYAGPENSDMTVAAVVLGLLSPALAFVVASNSGFSALSTVTSVANNAGVNTGFSPFNIIASPTDKPSTTNVGKRNDSGLY